MFHQALITELESDFLEKVKQDSVAQVQVTYIFVQVRLHNIFTREGKDIYCQVPIDMASAALGGNFEVPTIDGGKLKINYDTGTQSGKDLGLGVRNAWIKGYI